VAKLPTMWKPPAVTGRGNHTVADAPRLCRVARFGRSEAVNPGDLSRVDGQRFRSSAPGDQNAPKRGGGRASGQSVEARNDAAIHTLEVQWGEESERP